MMPADGLRELMRSFLREIGRPDCDIFDEACCIVAHDRYTGQVNQIVSFSPEFVAWLYGRLAELH